MTSLRAAFSAHPLLAAAIALAALLLRLAVPAGFMPVLDHGRVTLTLCPEAAPVPTAMAHRGHGGHHDAQQTDGGGAQDRCAFADLSLPLTGGVDAVLIAAALAFVMAAALLRPVPPAPRPAPRLRPPLRAPPLPA